MATRFPQNEHPLDTFIEAEQLIHSIFERIIGTAIEKRDRFLVKLNDIKLDYLKKEDSRKKHISEIEEMIRKMNEMNIEQVPVIEMQKDQITNLEKERKKYQMPTPIPVLGISTEGLESLLEQLRGFGIVEEVGGPYRERIKPVMKYAKEGNKKGELSFPSGLALYRNEKIYIADTNNGRIQIFSTAGIFLLEFGKGQLTKPCSIALNDKWVFVCDSNVFKFPIALNKFVRQSAKGLLNFPYGITVDTNGEVLVADCDNSRIAVLNSELELVREIGKGKLKYPRDVKIKNSNIFVADNNKINNIHIFTKTGDMIRSFIKLGDGTGVIYLCFDFFNNIIVSDYYSKSIQIFTTKGQLIHKIICESYPNGIALDSNNTNIICVCIDGVVYNY